MTEKQFNDAMERMSRKDKQALREVYEAYVAFIYRVVFDMVDNREKAEDITSDFFIRLWEKAGQYKKGNSHLGYLATIARNMAIDHMRKYGREVLQIDGEEDENGRQDNKVISSSEPTPEESVITDMSIEDVLNILKPVYRQIVTMKVLSDMTFKEIAKVLDMPIGTVTWNYREAIKQLRRFGYE
ncbi:MAG: RNA polymerase sigma factor [Lachnospiraceae bacterium]|nr:RNA polymerase sigma factor [Lachnospiraceae bacterium]